MPEANHAEFLISNLSLPGPLMVAGSVPAHERYMQATGVDGMELTPVRVGRFMGRLLYRANMLERVSTPGVPFGDTDSFGDRERIYSQLDYDVRKDWSDEDDAFERLVRAGHSSFRNDANGSGGLVARMVPDWRESLRQLRKIQHITGPLSAVLYSGLKDGTVVYNDENAPFAERTFQPTASDWHSMGLTEDSSIEEIRHVMRTRGFTGVTYDLLHAQIEKEGHQFRDPLALADRVAAAGLVRSIHLSVNRLDITGLHSEAAKSTRAAKEAFVRSALAASKTPEGEMLRVIAQTRQQAGGDSRLRVVLEDGPLRLGGAKKDHAAIITHARELISQYLE